jgi:hypothetical protein
VRKLIAGPTVFICDECVELCMDIIGGREQVLVGEVARWFRPPRKAVAAKEDIEPFGVAVVLELASALSLLVAAAPPGCTGSEQKINCESDRPSATDVVPDDKPKRLPAP